MSLHSRVKPIPSMYDIFDYIWLYLTVNVGKYDTHGWYGKYMKYDWLFPSHFSTKEKPWSRLKAFKVSFFLLGDKCVFNNPLGVEKRPWIQWSWTENTTILVKDLKNQQFQGTDLSFNGLWLPGAFHSSSQYWDWVIFLFVKQISWTCQMVFFEIPAGQACTWHCKFKKPVNDSGISTTPTYQPQLVSLPYRISEASTPYQPLVSYVALTWSLLPAVRPKAPPWRMVDLLRAYFPRKRQPETKERVWGLKSRHLSRVKNGRHGHPQLFN